MITHCDNNVKRYQQVKGMDAAMPEANGLEMSQVPP